MNYPTRLVEYVMRKKVLVADDAPFIREIVKQIIETHEMFVFVGGATNGKQAVSFAKKYQPDIILMDIVMPEMSGIMATEKILSENPNIKIISFTTMENDLIADQAKKAGCVKHLAKPFTKEDMINCLLSV